MAKKRLTVLADPVADSDVVEYFEGKGVTENRLKTHQGGHGAR